MWTRITPNTDTFHGACDLHVIQIIPNYLEANVVEKQQKSNNSYIDSTMKPGGPMDFYGPIFFSILTLL